MSWGQARDTGLGPTGEARKGSSASHATPDPGPWGAGSSLTGQVWRMRVAEGPAGQRVPAADSLTPVLPLFCFGHFWKQGFSRNPRSVAIYQIALSVVCRKTGPRRRRSLSGAWAEGRRRRGQSQGAPRGRGTSSRSSPALGESLNL